MPVQKPKSVLVLGYPYFVNRLKELGNSDDFTFQEMPKGQLQRWIALLCTDLIYVIGGDLRANRYYTATLFLKKKLIMHWVGTDILTMKELKSHGGHFSSAMVNQVTHWAEVDWTARELVEIGVTADIVPLTPAGFPESVKELPSKFVALTYLPAGKEDFYGAGQIIRLARELPDMVILVAAASPQEKNEEWPDNLIPIGWVNDMSELYREISVLIRLTRHDGLSFMVLEALAQGRHVIWSYPLDGVRHARNYDELHQAIRQLYERYQAGQLEVNNQGRKVVEERYSPTNVWGQISRGIVALLEKV